MRPRSRRLFACLLTSALMVGTMCQACRRQDDPGQNPGSERTKIILADGTQSISAAIYVALSEGYFDQEGLDVTLLPLTSGRDALAAVIAGKAQFATTAETPLMRAGLMGERAAAIATISTARGGIQIIARKDRGIQVPEDLRNKRIAVTKGTNGEFYLDLFLAFVGVDSKDVQLVYASPEELVTALTAGEVDAAATWPPHTLSLMDELGADAVSFCEEQLYTSFWNVVARPKYTVENPRVAEKMLRALIRAADFIAANPGRAAEIVAARIGTQRESVERALRDVKIAVSLDQTLLMALEDQARWALEKDGRTGAKVPNYLGLIDAGPLTEVAPDRVTVIREGRP